MVGEQADHAKKIGGAEVVVLDAPSVTALKADVEARPRIGRRDRRRRRPFVVGRSEAKAVEARCRERRTPTADYVHSTSTSPDSYYYDNSKH